MVPRLALLLILLTLSVSGQSPAPSPHVKGPDFLEESEGADLFTVVLFRSGKVIYKGGEHVRTKGLVTSRADKNQTEDLFRKVEGLDMGNLIKQISAQGGCVPDGMPDWHLTTYVHSSKNSTYLGCTNPSELLALRRDILGVTHAQRLAQIDILSLRSLLDSGEDLHKNQLDWMMAAIVWEDQPLMRELLRLGADPNMRLGEEPLFMKTAEEGRFQAAKTLLDAGADVRYTNRGENYYPADRLGNVSGSMMTLFLEHGLPPDSRGRENQTILIGVAVVGSRPEVIEALIKHGADVNAKDSEGRSALSIVQRRLKDFHEFLQTEREVLDAAADNPGKQQIANRDIRRIESDISKLESMKSMLIVAGAKE